MLIVRLKTSSVNVASENSLDVVVSKDNVLSSTDVAVETDVTVVSHSLKSVSLTLSMEYELFPPPYSEMEFCDKFKVEIESLAKELWVREMSPSPVLLCFFSHLLRYVTTV